MQADLADPLRRELARYGLRWAVPLAAVLVATGITAILFWPGFMSWDSLFQLTQARQGMRHNSHPPLMSYIWRPLDRVFPGPAPMLLLHALLFYGGAALLLWRLGGRALGVAAAILLLAVFPPLQGLLGVVWKDVGMMAFFMVAAACLASFQQTRSGGWMAAGLLATFAAVAYRHNAAAAAVPLWLWGGWLVAGSRLRALGVAAVMAVATLAAAYGVNNWRIPSAEAWRAIALHDLIGISVARNENLLPPYSFARYPGFGMDEVRRLYFPEHVNYAIYPVPGVNDGAPLLENDPSDKANMAALRTAWRDAVLHHPVSWLQHRMVFAGVFLGLTRPVFMPTQYGIEPNDLGITLAESRANRLAMDTVTQVARTPIAAPWLHYVAGSAALIFLWATGRATPAVLAVAASGYAYLLGSLAILPAADFRYHSWSFAAMLVLICLALMRPPPRSV